MGGSLARGLKGLPAPPEIHGVDKDPLELRRAMEAGVLDHAAGPEEPLPRGQDLVVYATPIGTALALMERHGSQLEPEALVTDMVSLKLPLQEQARRLGLEDRYVGSHPMVGGTGSGFEFARDTLFSGARVWVVPGEAEESAVERVEAFWTVLGAQPARIPALRHDEEMAWVSHLPQLTSNALALALRERDLMPEVLGTGALDMTRLAGSSPEMWEELLAAAPEGLLEALSSMEGWLSEIRKLLEEGRTRRLGSLMAETRAWRERS